MYAERATKLRSLGAAPANSEEDIRIYVQTTDNIYTFRQKNQVVKMTR